MSERQWVNKKCELGFHREEAEKPHSKSNGLQEELQERQCGNPGKEGANREASEWVRGRLRPLPKQVTLVGNSRQFDLFFFFK